MSTIDSESPESADAKGANADASSATTNTQATTNCQAFLTGQNELFGQIENSNPPKFQASIKSSSSDRHQAAMASSNKQALAPVPENDVTSPNNATTTRKAPMVTVPVQDSQTLVDALSQLNETRMDMLKDEQQARDLLDWNDGIGTLSGCDLRFKINQLGCLELLDSDDESENQNSTRITNQTNAISSSSLNKNSNTNNVQRNSKNSNIKLNKPANGVVVAGGNTTHDRPLKKAKLDIEQMPIRQISPGSSLLVGGPNMKRPKSRDPLAVSIVKHNMNFATMRKLLSKLWSGDKTKVNQWTTEDVKNFVDSIPGCSGCGELFELQQICGKSLLSIDQKDLLEVINVKLGPALKIYNAISLLK